ncbi:chromodomain protein Chp1 [Schizosaccharomyces osmophilus]|uniref:Chromodomain protein Chp1 n=1 Tax=Schizosaccharomyces osmophilus TaxID=2545709 RepID=A0AAE9WF46_9SCHI|nr:chromodomain protein Chp1 [Schizosaccharomyces osmophilus]WBW74623.1 chromodomain protein Chp1 [Schizosaccharomyces osmophilus]
MANSKKSTKRPKSKRNVQLDVYEVERILADRVNISGKNEYYIKWVGYDSRDNTWEPEENLTGASMALKDWQKKKGLIAAGLLQPYTFEEIQQKEWEQRKKGGVYSPDFNSNANEPLTQPAAKSKTKSKTSPKSPQTAVSQKRVTKRRCCPQVSGTESGNEQVTIWSSTEKKQKCADRDDTPSFCQSESLSDSPSISCIKIPEVNGDNPYSGDFSIGSPTLTSSIGTIYEKSVGANTFNASVNDYLWPNSLEQKPTFTSISSMKKADPSVTSHTIIISDITKSTAEKDIVSYFAFIPSKLDVRVYRGHSSASDVAYVKFDSADCAQIAYGKGHPIWRIALAKDDVYGTLSDPLENRKYFKASSSKRLSKESSKSNFKLQKSKSTSPRKPKNDLKVPGSRWTTVNNVWQEMPKTDALAE